MVSAFPKETFQRDARGWHKTAWSRSLVEILARRCGKK
jgi:hypothetical protein